MRRGTTPTLKICLNGIAPEKLKSIYVTMKQENTEITKENDQIVKEENVLSVSLSQEDTLSFKGGMVSVQVRALTVDGIAVASPIKNVVVSEILKDGVIT